MLQNKINLEFIKVYVDKELWESNEYQLWKRKRENGRSNKHEVQLNKYLM